MIRDLSSTFLFDLVSVPVSQVAGYPHFIEIDTVSMRGINRGSVNRM